MDDRILTSRFVVKRCDTKRLITGTKYEAFLVPQMAEFEGEDVNDAVENLIFDAKQSAIPDDLIFRHSDDAWTGAGPNESGIWLIVPEPIEPGTVVDLKLQIVAVTA